MTESKGPGLFWTVVALIVLANGLYGILSNEHVGIIAPRTVSVECRVYGNLPRASVILVVPGSYTTHEVAVPWGSGPIEVRRGSYIQCTASAAQPGDVAVAILVDGNIVQEARGSGRHPMAIASGFAQPAR